MPDMIVLRAIKIAIMARYLTDLRLFAEDDQKSFANTINSLPFSRCEGCKQISQLGIAVNRKQKLFVHKLPICDT